VLQAKAFSFWHLGGGKNFAREWQSTCDIRAIPPVATPLQETVHCFRKIICCSALAPALLLGFALPARSQSTAPSPQAQAEQSKQVSGKVTDIGSDRRSFSLEVSDKGSKHTMQL